MARVSKVDSWERYVPEKLRADLTKLPEGLLAHCTRTSEVAQRLAERFGYDPAKAKAAAMIHDTARAMSDRELLELAKQFELRTIDVEEDLPILLHGPVGAEILRLNYGLTDREMLDAIACHTTGKRGMGMLDKILFLADKIDPEKVYTRPELQAVEELSEKDLDRALLKFLDLQLASLIARGLPIHPAMVEARNGILMRLQG